MMYLTVGILGYIALSLADIISFSRNNAVQRSISSVGYLSIALSVIGAMAGASPAQLPQGLRSALIPAAVLWFSMTAYSVFLELPLYGSGTAGGNGKPRVVDRGTYGIVRHPGVVWFTFGMISLIALYEIGPFTVTAVVLILMDLILATVQDLVIFPRTIDGYDAYRREVPFIIPRKIPDLGALYGRR